MKTIFKLFAVAFTGVLLLTACKKEATKAISDDASNEISQEVLGQIKKLGFGTGSVQKVDEGYIVEGDILLTPKHLSSKSANEFLRIGDEEQYRTSNTVYGLPRTLTVRVSTTMPNYTAYVKATNAAIARYNALGLLIKFTRVTSGGNIVIKPAPSGASYLATAGFPNDDGNPYNRILINNTYLGSCGSSTRTSIVAHEMGHCIGFRHTDYKNRSYSCGGSAVNEGAGTVGAKLIPGTPSGPKAGSWMLACISCGEDRPFTSYNKIALNYLY